MGGIVNELHNIIIIRQGNIYNNRKIIKLKILKTGENNLIYSLSSYSVISRLFKRITPSAGRCNLVKNLTNSEKMCEVQDAY